jgi:hypothetical protein
VGFVVGRTPGRDVAAVSLALGQKRRNPHLAGFFTEKSFPKTQPFGPMFIGFIRLEKKGVFAGLIKG